MAWPRLYKPRSDAIHIASSSSSSSFPLPAHLPPHLRRWASLGSWRRQAVPSTLSAAAAAHPPPPRRIKEERLSPPPRRVIKEESRTPPLMPKARGHFLHYLGSGGAGGSSLLSSGSVMMAQEYVDQELGRHRSRNATRRSKFAIPMPGRATMTEEEPPAILAWPTR